MLKKQKESKKTILTMLFLVIGLALFTLAIYIPREMNYSNFDCKKLYQEKLLAIDLANYCSQDSDCEIRTDILGEPCNCYELLNKNIINRTKSKLNDIEKYYNEKNCITKIPAPSCSKYEIPPQTLVKCINKKCTISNDI